MGFPAGTLLAGGANGRNQVDFVKRIATVSGMKYSNGKIITDQEQQRVVVQKSLEDMPKGSNLSVVITNNHSTDRQNFRLLDVDDIALANNASDNGPDISIESSFAGTNSTAGYTCLRNNLTGSRMASIGTAFIWGSETYIQSAQMKIGNGNIEDYNFKTLQNYFLLAKDTYANDQKILVLSTCLWLNGYLAMTGSLPAGGSLTILLNVVGHGNF